MSYNQLSEEKRNFQSRRAVKAAEAARFRMLPRGKRYLYIEQGSAPDTAQTSGHSQPRNRVRVSG